MEDDIGRNAKKPTSVAAKLREQGTYYQPPHAREQLLIFYGLQLLWIQQFRMTPNTGSMRNKLRSALQALRTCTNGQTSLRS